MNARPAPKPPGWIAAVLCALLVCGCATQSLRQGHDLSSAGIAYADAIVALIDVTIDPVIDWDTTHLLRDREFLPADDHRKRLNEFNKKIEEELIEMAQLKRNTLLIRAYFVRLQAFSDSPVAQEAGAALKDLGATINSANQVIRKKGVVFTAEQQKYLEQIGTLVVRNIQAQQLRKILDEDKSIIAFQLAWQESVMSAMARNLMAHYELEHDKFKNERLITPYVNGPKPKTGAVPDKVWLQPDDWRDDRKLWLKSSFQVGALAKASEAAKHLQAVWAEILEGRGDLTSIVTYLEDIRALTDAVAAFNKAERARKD